MLTTTTTLTLSDGRDLCVESFGNSSAPAILFHSGTNAGRTLYPKLIEAAKRNGLFVLGYDRPGYGGSTQYPGRIIADCAPDVIAIAQHFNVDRLSMMGFSGGGSHSIASAVLLPDLVGAAVAFAPVRPLSVSEINQPPSFLDQATSRAYMEKDREQILSTTYEEMVAGNLEFPENQRVSVPFLEFHYGSMKAALEPGLAGRWDDMQAYITPWGLDLTANRVPVSIWHGKADVTVPFAHGEWLAQNTPHSELHLTPNDSHRSIFENSFEAALEWLLPRL